MARETFIGDLWSADRELHRPQERVERRYLLPNGCTKLLPHPDRWLTPRVVERYKPEDFSDFPPERQQELRSAVESFRQIATAVPPKTSATLEQAELGAQHLEKIISILREHLLPEWLAAMEKLVQDAETWSRRQDWAVKRDLKELHDGLLGDYSAPRLLIHTLDGRLLLDPVTRFASGVLGLAELCVMPSYDSTRIARHEDGWYLHPDPPDEPPRKWSEETFVTHVRELLHAQ
jgi:hypothetical protein